VEKMTDNMKESKVTSQVKKIVLYGIELDAERKEPMSISEHKKYELSRLKFTEDTDNLLNNYNRCR